MNISIDDTSPNFVWSNGAEDWRGPAPNQLSINSQYFLQTYHASQTKGANVAITFVGGAIQIYGSTGPNHGNYSVTFDNTIKFFAGFSTQIQYQQLLFSRVFGTNLSETHTVLLKNEENYWLDLDFVVLTVSTTASTSTSDIGYFTSTVTPGTSIPPSSTGTTTSDSTSSDSSSAPSIFKTLTFVLVGVLGFSIIALVAWYFVFHKRRSQGRHGGGRGRGMSNSSSQQEFQHAQKNGSLSGLDTSRTNASGGERDNSVLGFGRNKFGKEDYQRSPTSAGGGGGSISATEQSRYSRQDGFHHMGAGGNNAVVSGAARETLIALNNMGKRPGYRTLAGDAEGGSRTVVLVDGRETPTSLRTMGSGGQTWLGATKPNEDRDRDSGVRFKGRAGRESYNLHGKRSSSFGSDSNLSSRLAIQDRRGGGGGGGGLVHINNAKDEDQYAPSGIGLGMYAANIRNESEQQRMLDLKRSASVASSGILDRLTSSPPPAVPELPPSATTSSINSSHMVPPPRSFSPAQTESSTVHSHGGVQSGLGLATKVQHPYGRNNEMLVHSHSGSLNSTSGGSAITAVNNGSLPLRPPPARVEEKERERERAMQRERERLEKEREANSERLHQREREMQRKAEARYSRPPPEYVPTPTASQISVGTVSGSGLQRQGTRTGDIPIGFDGGAGYGYESESQDSHSVAHAYVGTAQHVTVSPPVLSQPPASTRPLQQQQKSFSPPRPQHHVQRDGQMGSTGSSNLGLPNGTTVTGTSAKRAVTPDRGRSYDPGRAVAVSSGARSNTPTGMGAGGQPAWVGRASEESSKTWGLDGVHGSNGQEKMRQGPGLGRPIMDDRARLAVGAPGGANQAGQRISRVPPPRA